MNNSHQIQHSFLSDGYFLTDGGLETTLVFHHGIELPHFAAFELVTSEEGQQALMKYYQPYLDLAREFNLNFILETPTWRANTEWGEKLGYSVEELAVINRQAVHFLRTLQLSSTSGKGKIYLSGCVGPRSDGYKALHRMTANEAMAYHRPQVQIFSEENTDVITAMTINYCEEAIGIIRAAKEASIPAVISFTVETDGALPDKTPLKEAVMRVDRETGGYATHFMINCAHPEHFKHVLNEDGVWKNRIRGIRANASTRSHAELDEAETLDTGDMHGLAEGYAELRQLLPDIRVIGGCCGTDHRHLETLCKRLIA